MLYPISRLETIIIVILVIFWSILLIPSFIFHSIEFPDWLNRNTMTEITIGTVITIVIHRFQSKTERKIIDYIDDQVFHRKSIEFSKLVSIIKNVNDLGEMSEEKNKISFCLRKKQIEEQLESAVPYITRHIYDEVTLAVHYFDKYSNNRDIEDRERAKRKVGIINNYIKDTFTSKNVKPSNLEDMFGGKISSIHRIFNKCIIVTGEGKYADSDKQVAQYLSKIIKENHGVKPEIIRDNDPS